MDGADRQRIRLERRTKRTSQDRMDTSGEFLHAKRLGNIIIRAEFETKDFIGFIQFGGEEDDGRFTVLAVGFDEVVPAHLRHHDIEQDKVGLFAAGSVKGFPPIGGDDDAKAFCLKIVAHEVTDVGFVIGDEDGFHEPMIAERCSESV